MGLVFTFSNRYMCIYFYLWDALVTIYLNHHRYFAYPPPPNSSKRYITCKVDYLVNIDIDNIRLSNSDHYIVVFEYYTSNY